MNGLSSVFLKSLGITPDGKCEKHPQITLIADNSSHLQECDLCWKVQYERRGQEGHGGDNDTTNTEKLAAVPPSGLSTIPSGSMVGGFPSSGKDTAWRNAVHSRWAQVEELGVDTTLENGEVMEADREKIATERTNLQLKMLEEHVKRQDKALQKLQETLEKQESNIRQDIQQLMQAFALVIERQHPENGEKNSASNHNDSGLTFPTNNGKSGEQRPGMYAKLRHPSNLFSSVRTMERQPPKPPMRHGSFSTNPDSRIVGGSIPSASISSLEASTKFTNDHSSHHEIELDIQQPDPSHYGPGLESLLEKERTKQLEIIFDASGRLSTDFLDESSGGKNTHRRENTGDGGGGGDHAKSTSPLALRLESEVELGHTLQHDNDVLNSRSSAPKFQNAGGVTQPLRQPRRAPSERNVDVQSGTSSPPKGPAGRKSKAGEREKSTDYVPPQPPPPLQGKEEEELTRQDPREDPASNLARLSLGLAPPRREIFASWRSSKMQISCLTIDTAIDQSAHGDFGNVYHEVKSFQITDKFGDSGFYTGRLREQADGSGDAVYEPDGYGAMTYDSGAFYVGAWKAGQWHGNGHLQNANKDVYEGDFVYDCRHGRGIYRYANGDEYEGDFTEDQRHGKGIFKFASGATYRGDLKYGNFDGYGTFTFEEGRYEGSWYEGAYHGIGTLQFKNGRVYTGSFKRGVADGPGEEKYADGRVIRGTWKDGAFVEEAVSAAC